MIADAIRFGVCKFNVNTEVREAYVRSLQYTLSSAAGLPDLLDLMRAAQAAMQQVIMEKFQIFGEPVMKLIHKHNLPSRVNGGAIYQSKG
jgi:tagatose 1,6-diphosphate aldolase GatY/KbaY